MPASEMMELLHRGAWLLNLLPAQIHLAWLPLLPATGWDQMVNYQG